MTELKWVHERQLNFKCDICDETFSAKESLDNHIATYFTEVNNEHGWTPLHVATRKGHLQVVKFLVENGAVVDSTGKAPLHLISSQGGKQLLKLIENGAQIDAMDNEGNTPLHLAIQNNQIHIVKYLIQNAANINAKDEFGWTPLHDAAEGGLIEFVKLLVENGAQIDSMNDKLFTPLCVAIQHNETDIVKYLIQNSANIVILQIIIIILQRSEDNQELCSNRKMKASITCISNTFLRHIG